MSTPIPPPCTGLDNKIPVNSDIAGPGVRIALYLQSALSVILIRYSPRDAPGTYWAMTSMSFALIVTSFASIQSISLLDAIIVVYLLVLPILASAFGLSRITNSSSSNTRRMFSPLLIVANWMRSALTYIFAIYVWSNAATFGSAPECNPMTNVIFFGASLSALRAGRILNLTFWILLAVLFVYRTLKGFRTLCIATLAMFSPRARQWLIKPMKPNNRIHIETKTKTNYRTGHKATTEKDYRPKQVFHEIIQGMTSQILGRIGKQGGWYQKYGQVALGSFLGLWAIVMTELELVLNNAQRPSQWGFGQILPMILTIAPLFSLFEWMLASRSSGPSERVRKVRITVKEATGLKRPQCEVDEFPEIYTTPKFTERHLEKIRKPSPFAAITLDDRDVFVTYEQDHANDPDWGESFDLEVTDLSTVVIRVYDLKCIDRGWPALIGYTVLLPFSILPPGDESPLLPTTGGEAGSADGSGIETPQVIMEETATFPLTRKGQIVPDHNLTISLSTNTATPLPEPKLPQKYRGLQRTVRETKINYLKICGMTFGSKERTTTEIYELGG
ncbi:hypothetical protein BD410DRAFT_895025 [Rickenella mellea]|uniref:C2 domain-containing protein n=1 Tax=Rickenella mellea TaxID=50990 RepID=A0A4Y7QHJ7_9AGAM|nr:hypothetical protein BD410DRAFT_895025 [Rickenella mellea]